MEKTEGEENIGRGKSSFFGHPKFEKVTRFVIDHLCFPINLILFVLKLYLQKECLAMYNGIQKENYIVKFWQRKTTAIQYN
jgi:hypothetical protein